MNRTATTPKHFLAPSEKPNDCTTSSKLASIIALCDAARALCAA
jgi:hypothetical protein